MQTLRKSCYHNIRVPSSVKYNKARLIEHILQYHTPEQRIFLLERIQDHLRSSSSFTTRPSSPPCFAPGGARVGGDVRRDNSNPAGSGSFPCIPSSDDKLGCMKRFWDSTGNAATKRSVCGVCSRELREAGETFSECPVSSLPHRDSLVPPISHPKHQLTDGLLLEPRGLITQGDALVCRVCSRCRSQLSKPKLVGPMKYSLANNLWVGDDPGVLAELTLPEQLLISLAYPRVFQFNLYCAGQEGGPGPFQKGLRGNVTTHPLDLDGLVEAAKGNRLPRPLEVLPSLIKITILGRNQLDRRRLIPLFTVRRGQILRALIWFKENNPKYYGSITIDRAALDKLPPDSGGGAVPKELLRWVRQNDNIHAVHREEGGYVQSEGLEYLESDLSEVPDHRE